MLVAGLLNPTVRRRYVAVHELLADYGHVDFYETLLGLLGCAQMNRACVEQHLAALTKVFDVATAMVKTPFFFASDISEIARPIAIDGSWELIARGCHREAILASRRSRICSSARNRSKDCFPVCGSWQKRFWRLIRRLKRDEIM